MPPYAYYKGLIGGMIFLLPIANKRWDNDRYHTVWHSVHSGIHISFCAYGIVGEIISSISHSGRTEKKEYHLQPEKRDINCSFSSKGIPDWIILIHRIGTKPKCVNCASISNTRVTEKAAYVGIFAY